MPDLERVFYTERTMQRRVDPDYVLCLHPGSLQHTQEIQPRRPIRKHIIHVILPLQIAEENRSSEKCGVSYARNLCLSSTIMGDTAGGGGFWQSVPTPLWFLSQLSTILKKDRNSEWKSTMSTISQRMLLCLIMTISEKLNSCYMRLSQQEIKQ